MKWSPRRYCVARMAAVGAIAVETGCFPIKEYGFSAPGARDGNPVGTAPAGALRSAVKACRRGGGIPQAGLADGDTRRGGRKYANYGLHFTSANSERQ